MFDKYKFIVLELALVGSKFCLQQQFAISKMYFFLQVIAFQKPVRQVSANKVAGKARKKLLKLCNETKV